MGCGIYTNVTLYTCIHMLAEQILTRFRISFWINDHDDDSVFVCDWTCADVSSSWEFTK